MERRNRPSCLTKMRTTRFPARTTGRSLLFGQVGSALAGVAVWGGRTLCQTSSFLIATAIHSHRNRLRMASWPIGLRLGLFRFATGPGRWFPQTDQFFNTDVSALDDLAGAPPACAERVAYLSTLNSFVSVFQKFGDSVLVTPGGDLYAPKIPG